MNNWNLLYITIVGFIGFGIGMYFPLPFYLSFLGLGAVGEVTYLGMMSTHPRFQKHIRSQKRLGESKKEEKKKEIYEQLSLKAKKRFYKVYELKNDIEVNYGKMDYTSQGVLNSHIEKIEGVLDSYLRLLHQKEHYKDLAADSTKEELQESIDQLQEDMSDDSERVRSMKEKRLNVLKKRFSRFENAQENLEIIKTQIGTIEDALIYIHEESWNLQDPEEITFELDNLLNRVEETKDVLHGDVHDAFDQELDILDNQLQSSTEEDLNLDSSGSTKSRVRS